MEIIFYGSRGSTPVNGREFMDFGGNTTCIAVKADDRLFLVDCGTGMQRVQKELFSPGNYREADIFLTHLHWDHIQGIAFFSPFFKKECRFSVYGEEREGESIKRQIESIMRSPVFPVNADAFQADIHYKTIRCGDRIILGNLEIDTIRLDHPNICTGYRFKYDNKTVSIITDCENINSDMIEFVKGTELLICDGQYTEEEYKNKTGWGHGTWEAACRTASDCGARRLIITHHDPEHTDETLKRLEQEAVTRFKETQFAYDGMKCIL